MFFFSDGLDGWTLLRISRSLCSGSLSGSFEEPAPPLDRPARARVTAHPPRDGAEGEHHPPVRRVGVGVARSGAMMRASATTGEETGRAREEGIRWATARPDVLVASTATVRTPHAPAPNANMVSVLPRARSLRCWSTRDAHGQRRGG